VSSFLYGVAYRVAVRIKRAAARQQLCRRPETADSRHGVEAEVACRELQALVDEELNRLPETYRAPFVLCCLEGKSRAEAAEELGCKEGTVSSRLAEARTRLRQRLTRRGVSLSVALCLTDLAASSVRSSVPGELFESTARILSRSAAARPGVVAAVEGLRQSHGAMIRLVFGTVVAVGLVSAAVALSRSSVEVVAALPGEEHPPAPTDAKRRPATGVDRYGDPLPADAIARLGTVRFRHGWYVTALAYTPDGKYLATTGGGRGLCVWNARTGELVSVPPVPTTQAFALAISPDSKLLAAQGKYPSIQLYDLPDGREVQTLKGHGGGATMCYAFSPDGKVLATGGHDKLVRLWDVATGEEIRKLEGAAGSLFSVAYSPDGSLVAGSGLGKTVSLWDAATGKLRSLSGHAERVAFSPAGKLLATASNDGTVRLWDTAAARELRVLRGPPATVRAVTFSPDGRFLATAQPDGRIRIWDTDTAEELRNWRAHAGQIVALAFAPDGATLTSAGEFNSVIRHWDPLTGRERRPVGGPQGKVSDVRFSADGRTLFVSAHDLTLRRWDRVRDEETVLAVGHPPENIAQQVVDRPATALGRSPTGGARMVTYNFEDHTIRARGSEDREPQVLGTHPGNVMALASSPDGRLVASGGSDRTIRVWDVGAGKLVYACKDLEDGVSALAFSPDGKSFVSGISREVGARSVPGRGVRLWDAATGKVTQTFDCNDRVSRLVLSPDGSLLGAGTIDLTQWPGRERLFLWDVATGKELSLPDAVKKCYPFAISSDGKLLALTDRTPGLNNRDTYNTVSIVEIATGQEIQRFKGHADGVTAAAFSRDGKLLATGGADATVLVFDRTGRHGTTAATADLEKCWNDLASTNAATAHAAVQSLACDERRTVPFLNGRLRPAAPLDEAGQRELRQSLADLDGDSFRGRQEAAQRLEQIGELAETELRKTLQGKPTPEARKAIERLLEKLSAPVPTRLRGSRAIMSLEYMGTSDARRLLSELSRGAPEVASTREAAAALRRLEAPPTDGQ
jgi:WD40 repeat protein